MRIALLITVAVMNAMDRDPARRAVLEVEHTHGRKRILKPFRAGEAAMRQQTVVADGDAEHTKNEVSEYCNGQA